MHSDTLYIVLDSERSQGCIDFTNLCCFFFPNTFLDSRISRCMITPKTDNWTEIAIQLKHFLKFTYFFRHDPKSEMSKFVQSVSNNFKFSHIFNRSEIKTEFKLLLISTIFERNKELEKHLKFVYFCSFYFVKPLIFSLKTINFCYLKTYFSKSEDKHRYYFVIFSFLIID